mgnify:CR=1 FL=1|tara:strand:+ start:301 stop:540 length:240 start_codon:yes stop_codon:yes gene_type:complete
MIKTMTDTQKRDSYPYRLGECKVALEFMKEERDSLLSLLAKVAGLIEDYCDDHNSDSPTDVTVILPELRAAICRAGGDS